MGKTIFFIAVKNCSSLSLCEWWIPRIFSYTSNINKNFDTQLTENGELELSKISNVMAFGFYLCYYLQDY